MNAMPETKKKLKAYFEEHQAPPAPALEEIRRQVILSPPFPRVIGFHAELCLCMYVFVYVCMV